MSNLDPCKLCVVDPICNKGCEGLAEFLKDKLILKPVNMQYLTTQIRKGILRVDSKGSLHYCG